MAKLSKIDSNITGLRYAEEESLKVLPDSLPAVAATGTLTFGGEGVENETITIGTQTYVLRDTFYNDQDEIIIGATAEETAQRLADAINRGAQDDNDTVVGAGTQANADVTATVVGSVIHLTAITAGAAGNSIVTTETSTQATFSAATLLGGQDAAGNPPVWIPLEPNSYSDFGGQVATVAREPIDPSRQRKKGVITDLDASGGFNTDLTQTNLQGLLQGFFFADLRHKKDSAVAEIAISEVAASSKYYKGTGLNDLFGTGTLLNASGFGQGANNGLKRVVTATGTEVEVAEVLVDEAAPPAAAKLTEVGFQFTTSDVTVDVSGSLPRIVSATKDLRTFGIVPGEWIYVGGDTTATHFAKPENNGFKRVRSVTETYIEIDKSALPMDTDAGTGKTIQLFFGRVLKNETGNLIKRRTYQLERTLGAPETTQPTQVQSEYLIGAVANELVLNVNTADKINVDLSFVACDHETRTGVEGLKGGSRPALTESDAFNTSSDFSRIKLSRVSDTDEATNPLFAFVTDLTLTINNNVTPNKAVGTLGAFDVTAGTFTVTGEMTAYFADVDAVKAVRENANVSLDMVIVKNNAGLAVDIPLVTLSNARANVEKDAPITLPITSDAASGAAVHPTLNHTLLLSFFDYLPTAADL